MRLRYYIGINLLNDAREVFATARRPTAHTHGKRYVAVIGPFRNVRAALWTRDNPGTRPVYRCGLDLEKTCKSRPQPAIHTAAVRLEGKARSSRTDRPYDAIDTVLDQVGGVPRKPKTAAGRRDTLGIWAGYAEAVHAGVLKLLPPSATRPDEIAQVLGLNTAEDAWLALADAARARRGDRSTLRKEDQLLDRDAQSAEDFSRSALCHAGGKRAEPVRADELSIGDTFAVDREKFTVAFVDPDTEDVIVEDGVRFGKQTLMESAVLCPDPGSWQRAASPEQIETSPF